MHLDTKPFVSAADVSNEYGLRPVIEERHRQLKCFSGIEDFSSRAFTLVVNQVAFVLLTYSLLQWYLLRTDRKKLNPKTQSRILELLRPVFSVTRHLLSKLRRVPGPIGISGNGTHSF